MDELEFCHYETCYDERGWSWVKAWYWCPSTGSYVWFKED